MFITVNGKKIHYLREGRGVPILFVHGWGGSIKSLEKLHATAAKQFDSIIVDLPGFGKSDPPDTNWGVHEYSSIVLDLIKKLNLHKITFFGHSFGGSLGIILSAKYPEIISHLILSNSAYRRHKPSSRTTKFIKNNILSSVPFKHIWEAPTKKFFYKIFFRNSDLTRFPELESNFRKIITEDLTALLSKIKTPTLILWGDKDTYTPIDYAHELKSKIQNSVLKIFPEKKHNLPLIHPDLTFQEIQQFLRK